MNEQSSAKRCDLVNLAQVPSLHKTKRVCEWRGATVISACCSKQPVITLLPAALGFLSAPAERKPVRFVTGLARLISTTVTKCESCPTVAPWAARMCSLHSATM